jgi:hypothetical protein
MVDKILKFFNSPYPFYEDTKQGFKVSLGIGMFIGLFCYLFRPFGLHTATDTALLGFGMVSFFVCAFYMMLLPLVFKKELNHKGWKIYKEILWILLITTSIATANYFYLGYIYKSGYAFNLSIFILILIYTALIAVIPAITIIFYKQVFIYKKIVREVEKIDAKLVSKNSLWNNNIEEKVIFRSDTKKNNVEIFVNQFIAVTSYGNYLEVLFMEEDVLVKKLIRNAISNIENDLKGIGNIIRCHRSHIINLDQVDKVEGNLQGYQLFLKIENLQIPVSRSYTKKVKQAILK